MAAANALLLGIFGYLVLCPVKDSHLTDFSQSRLSTEGAPAPVSAIPEQPGLAANPLQAAAPLSDPASGGKLSQTAGWLDSTTQAPVLPSPSSDSHNANDTSANPDMPAARSRAVQPITGRVTSANTTAGEVPGIISTIALPPNAATPLALTTSPEGATPSQAAALGRLQNDFVESVSRQGQNFESGAYAKTWQAAQALSDSNFAQQFGSEAFIEAQLAQFHGGAD